MLGLDRLSEDAEVVLGPAGRRVLILDEGRLTLWDGTSGEPLDTPPLQEDVVDAILETGDQLVVATADDVVHVYDLATGEEQFRFVVPGDLRGAFVGPGGEGILTIDSLGDRSRLRWWETAAASACERIELIVTTNELLDALGGDAPRACTGLRP